MVKEHRRGFGFSLKSISLGKSPLSQEFAHVQPGDHTDYFTELKMAPEGISQNLKSHPNRSCCQSYFQWVHQGGLSGVSSRNEKTVQVRSELQFQIHLFNRTWVTLALMEANSGPYKYSPPLP